MGYTMGNIFADIAEEIEIKPSKSKLVIKWIIRVATVLIAGAFTYGQIKMTRTAKINSLETSIAVLKESQEKGFAELNTKLDNMDANFNARINKVYEDAQEEYAHYQEFNRKQLELIIDYGSENKDMLKRMLEMNSMENQRRVEANLDKAKTETYTPEIEVVPIDEYGNEIKPYYGMANFIELSTNDTTFNIQGATAEFIASIQNNNDYKITGDIVSSKKYAGRYDFQYKNK